MNKCLREILKYLKGYRARDHIKLIVKWGSYSALQLLEFGILTRSNIFMFKYFILTPEFKQIRIWISMEKKN